MISKQRVAVFLDVQNLYHSARALYDARVNFGELLREAVGDRQLVRALAYAVSGGVPEEKGFFDALRKMGIDIKTKELLTFPSGKQKGNMDMEIAIDAMSMAPKLDAVILGSGDGDFAVLASYLKSQGCKVEVCAFGRSTSQKLIDATDEFLDLDSAPQRFLIVPKKRAVRRQRLGTS
jgi:uncharacterized LabA/DUF88 family protein